MTKKRGGSESDGSLSANFLSVFGTRFVSSAYRCVVEIPLRQIVDKDEPHAAPHRNETMSSEEQKKDETEENPKEEESTATFEPVVSCISIISY